MFFFFFFFFHLLRSAYCYATGPTQPFYLRGTDGSPAVKLGEGDAQDLSPDGKWVLVRQADATKLALVPAGTGVP